MSVGCSEYLLKDNMELRLINQDLQLVGDWGQTKANPLSLEKNSLRFHLVSDQGQIRARLLFLENILYGFHLVGDQGHAEARLLFLEKKFFKVST